MMNSRAKNSTKGDKKVIAKILPLLAVLTVFALWLFDRFSPGFEFGKIAGESFLDFLTQMAMVLPAAFLLIGLFDVWVPRSLIERHLGKGAGIKAVLWIILLATFQAGPLYAAFPVALALWKKGCTPRNVFIYLGTFSTLKIPMLTFEVTFLGWAFSISRVLITLPVFILLSIILDKILTRSPSLPIPCGEAYSQEVDIVQNAEDLRQ